uniref:Uncharacterized protein n=1 Tax=Trichuris muris TaxID=70415 RepID=A0A5S6QV78_TRIMR
MHLSKANNATDRDQLPRIVHRRMKSSIYAKRAVYRRWLSRRNISADDITFNVDTILDYGTLIMILMMAGGTVTTLTGISRDMDTIVEDMDTMVVDMDTTVVDMNMEAGMGMGMDMVMEADTGMRVDMGVGADMGMGVDMGVGADMGMGMDMVMGADVDMEVGMDVEVGMDMEVVMDMEVDMVTVAVIIVLNKELLFVNEIMPRFVSVVIK